MSLFHFQLSEDVNDFLLVLLIVNCACLNVHLASSLRGRRLKGKGKGKGKGALGKGVLGARETRGAREGGVRRETPARKPLFSPSRLLIKKITKITQL